MAYEINYNDERLTKVEAEKDAAIKESDQMYDSMIGGSKEFYQGQIDAAKQWGETQKQNQQAQTDFAIEKIEQQKDQTHKDYLKEQSGAYVDWQKQKNDYGSNAEQQAASGLAHTGYSESSQVAMYNQYQNRVATAREVYNRAVLNYDNAIKDAQLQNNSILAEIAYNTLQTSLELGLQGFLHEEQLLQSKAAAKREIDATHWTKYQNVLDNIYKEDSMAEQIRQYNESLAEQKRQYNETLAENKRQFNETIALQKKNSSVSYSGGGSSGGSYQTTKSSGSAAVKMGEKAGKAATKATALAKASGVKSYGDAVALLGANGITNKAKKSTPLLSPTSWLKAKKTGEAGSDIDNFDTYQEYVREYTKWAIKTYM